MIKLLDIAKEILNEDRCKRIADRRYSKPSAYKSGAIVRCRKGNIWKGLKEEDNSNQKHIIYPNFQGLDPAENVVGTTKEINVKDAIGNEPNKNLNYFQTEKKDYVNKMIKSAQNDGWKNFPPVVAINHPLLPGKFLVIDGNHRLGAFKIGNLPKIKATIVSDDNILLAVPGTKWEEGVVPKTIPLKNAKGKINTKDYFNTIDLKLPVKEGEYDNQGDGGQFTLAKKNPFNIKKLIDKKILFITKPGDGKGGVDEPNWEGDASIITLWNMAKAEPWMKLAVKSPMPQAIPYIQNNQDKVIYNGKYNQILWGIKKMGLKPEDFYVNKPKELNEAKKETLRTWFKRKGAAGKTGGWVDCNTCRKDKKTGRKKCKPCGRQKGEKRAKYPSCRPTPSQCGDPGKGKSWGKTK